jgi:glycosyltransferase involved in cell wall biosynthesis
MKVSFVLPVYNVMPYLERCVQSLVCQTFKDFEIILVDDGSPDDSGKLCEELATRDERIRVIHQENKGISGARNTGIDNATGEYIIFVDSDDYWLLDDGLQALVDNCGPQTDMVAFKGVDIWKGGRMTNTVDYNLEDISRISDAQALFAYLIRTQQMHLTVWLLMVRRRLLLDHQIYFPSYPVGEDFCWHFELWQHLSSVKMLNLNLYAYCHRQGSATAHKDLLAPYIIYDKIFTYWKERCQKGCTNTESILAFLANIWINRGYQFYRLKASDRPKALEILRKHADLLEHAATPKAKRTVKILHFVGLRATVYLLGLYWRLRSRIKGNAV